MNYVQKFYLKKLGEYLRKKIEEKRSSNKKNDCNDIKISKSTISRIINAKRSIKVQYLPFFFNILEIDTIVELYFNESFCYDLIEDLFDLIVSEKNSNFARRFEKLLRRKYANYKILTTQSLARIYYYDNKIVIYEDLIDFAYKLLEKDKSSYEVAKEFEQWLDRYLIDF
ncbi:hypothetical protein FH692_05425 [Streptococcus suis]|uniref:Uncharacterized protein n=1 Tax=Streptococcus suis TaxID=1307 RepID=A0A540UXN1_STRSU|nr:hypothetical protein [Streptococcus suis]TQE88803.1 hypothetical protein FH692_05425 [Streptococcus suis]